MNLLISYDISNTKIRTKLAKTLQGFGDRVQKSVFEAPNLDEIQRERLYSRLKEVKLKKHDSIRVYELCDGCRKRIVLFGIGAKPMDDPDVIIV